MYNIELSVPFTSYLCHKCVNSYIFYSPKHKSILPSRIFSYVSTFDFYTIIMFQTLSETDLIRRFVTASSTRARVFAFTHVVQPRLPWLNEVTVRTMDVSSISMHSTMGNRMRMWPNRQRIGLRIRSASAGRDKRSGECDFRKFYILFGALPDVLVLLKTVYLYLCDLELRNRSWAFLFDNLRRNIDEIYQICETDENVYECKVSFVLILLHAFYSTRYEFCNS